MRVTIECYVNVLGSVDESGFNCMIYWRRGSVVEVEAFAVAWALA
jgi:hypothetical protein